MRLVDAYTNPDAVDVLWALLSERLPWQSISHRSMPTVSEHRAFIASKPYPHWYLIDCGDFVGAAYLTANREIGIGILNRFKGHRYAQNALKMLMALHPGKFLANINPANYRSIALFNELGFVHIQNTYELR